MSLKFQCPFCRGPLAAEEHVSGYETDCPHCNKRIRTPASGVFPGLILDDWRIERLLGRGSMGAVYLATQVSLGRRVALKILSSAMTGNPAAVDRFMKEMRTLARLSHPNIVTAYAAGQSLGAHFLAMSYVRGETVSSRLARKGKMAEEDALCVALAIARALKYAWDRHHLLHRDIKPANIMIDSEGDVKLMDLGLSKSMSDGGDATQTGMLLGTPHYMSPEQSQSRGDLDVRADIYSLGCSLFHMVTGSPPYPGTSIPDIIHAQIHAPPPSAHERNPAVTIATSRLLEKMMSKKREHRQGSWDELIADLSRVLAEQFPLATPDVPLRMREVPIAPQSGRKSRSGLWVVGLALILLGFGGVELWRQIQAGSFATAGDSAGLEVATQPEGQDLTNLISKRLERMLSLSGRGEDADTPLGRRPAPQRLKLMLDSMRALDRHAQPLIKSGKFAEAAKAYMDYKGAWATESSGMRRAAANVLNQRAEDAKRAAAGTNSPAAHN